MAENPNLDLILDSKSDSKSDSNNYLREYIIFYVKTIRQNIIDIDITDINNFTIETILLDHFSKYDAIENKGKYDDNFF
jgi:hypothetical protein